MPYTPVMLPFMVSAVILSGLAVRGGLWRGTPGAPFFALAVAAAAAASIATIRHGVASDETAFIAKPYDAKALLAKVREVLEAGSPGRA